MEEKDIPKGATITPMPALRFKITGKGKAAKRLLQQRFRIEGDKVMFYLWRPVPEVDEGEPD